MLKLFEIDDPAEAAGQTTSQAGALPGGMTAIPGVPEKLPDLRQVETAAYANYHQDGLADILAGVLLIGGSLALQADNWPALAIAPALALVALAGARRWVRYPRVGYFKYAPRAARPGARVMQLLLGVALVLLLAGVVLAVLRRQVLITLPQLTSPTPGWGLAALVGLALTAVGWSTGGKRWYAYAILALAAAGVAQVLRLTPLPGLSVAGVAVGLAGIVHLVLFLRRYPVLGGVDQRVGRDQRTGR